VTISSPGRDSQMDPGLLVCLQKLSIRFGCPLAVLRPNGARGGRKASGWPRPIPAWRTSDAGFDHSSNEADLNLIFKEMYSQTERVGVQWNPMWSPDESLSAAAVGSTFYSRAGWVLHFSGGYHPRKEAQRRLLGRVRQDVRCSCL
jgi:hypothetical protein